MLLALEEAVDEVLPEMLRQCHKTRGRQGSVSNGGRYGLITGVATVERESLRLNRNGYG